jgi:hypothetical protein
MKHLASISAIALLAFSTIASAQTPLPCQSAPVTHPDGTITMTVVSDCPGGFPHSIPIYVGPPHRHASELGIGIAIGAAVILGGYLLFGRHADPIPHLAPAPRLGEADGGERQ